MNNVESKKDNQLRIQKRLDTELEWHPYPQEQPSPKAFRNYLVVRDKGGGGWFFQIIPAGYKPKRQYSDGDFYMLKTKTHGNRFKIDEQVLFWAKLPDNVVFHDNRNGDEPDTMFK